MRREKDSAHNWSEITSLIESISGPAVLINRNYKILAVNNAYELTYETTNEKAQQKYCYEISHRYTRPCDEAGETCPLKQSTESKQPHRVLHLHHTPRGEEHVDVEMRPILDKKGEILYFLETMRTSKVASSHAEGDGLIGRAPTFNHMLELIERVAPTEANVLLATLNAGEVDMGDIKNKWFDITAIKPDPEDEELNLETGTLRINWVDLRDSEGMMQIPDAIDNFLKIIDFLEEHKDDYIEFFVH